MAIAIYVRKSVERENSISCETQIEYCRMMLKPEERTEKVLTFEDNGYSGGNTDRDGFQEMMKQIRCGNISKVICYRLDRISRSLPDFVNILDTLKKYGVRFVSSQESFDTSTPYGEMIVKILIVFAEFERQSIIERVTQAYAHRSDLGFYMGGRRPYGFTLGDTELHGIKTKMLCPAEEEIGQIRYIFETYAAGSISLHCLMDNLTKNSVFPEKSGWSTAKISAILQNPIYVRADNAVYEYYSRRSCHIISDITAFDGIHGVQLYGRNKHDPLLQDMSDMKIVVMPHEGVVSSEIWLACQKKIVKNKRNRNSLNNTTSWLGGKIICRNCGHIMRAAKGNLHIDGSYTRYFSCTGKSNRRDCTGVKVTLYADSLENTIYKLIAQKFSSLKDIWCSPGKAPVNRRTQLKNHASAIRSSQERLMELLLNESIGSDMLRLLNGKAQEMAEKLQEISEQTEELEETEAKIADILPLAGIWEKASYEEKKTVAGVLIDKIYIDEDGTMEVVWNI